MLDIPNVWEGIISAGVGVVGYFARSIDKRIDVIEKTSNNNSEALSKKVDQMQKESLNLSLSLAEHKIDIEKNFVRIPTLERIYGQFEKMNEKIDRIIEMVHTGK